MIIKNTVDNDIISSTNLIKDRNGVVCLKRGIIKLDLQTVFIDIDDVLLNTSQAIIDILKDLFAYDSPDILNMGLKDVVFWDYENFIQGRLSKEELLEIFESNRFWNTVTVNKRIVQLIEKWVDKYNFVFVSKGSVLNLEKKLKLINRLSEYEEVNDKIGYIGIKTEYGKDIVDMSNGIQIDDNCKFLEDTNASIKILFRIPETKAESNYNGVQAVADSGLNNLYITEYIDEIDTILDFNFKNNIIKI